MPYTFYCLIFAVYCLNFCRNIFVVRILLHFCICCMFNILSVCVSGIFNCMYSAICMCVLWCFAVYIYLFTHNSTVISVHLLLVVCFYCNNAREVYHWYLFYFVLVSVVERHILLHHCAAVCVHVSFPAPPGLLHPWLVLHSAVPLHWFDSLWGDSNCSLDIPEWWNQHNNCAGWCLSEERMGMADLGGTVWGWGRWFSVSSGGVFHKVQV